MRYVIYWSVIAVHVAAMYGATGCANYQFGDHTRAALERCRAAETEPGQCRAAALRKAYAGVRIAAKLTGTDVIAPLDAVTAARKLLADYRAVQVEITAEDAAALEALVGLTAAEKEALSKMDEEQ